MKNSQTTTHYNTKCTIKASCGLGCGGDALTRPIQHVGLHNKPGLGRKMKTKWELLPSMAVTVIVVVGAGPWSVGISAVNVVLVRGSSRERGRETCLQETLDDLLK